MLWVWAIWTGWVWAQTGDAWLTRIDNAAKVDDIHLVLDVTVTDAKGRTVPRTLEIWQQGAEHRLVKMVAPARLRGVGLLVGADDTLHLFLPNYPPARRVVGSKRADAFMGTDFAIDDLSRMGFAETYTAAVEGQQGEQTRLLLTPHNADDHNQLRLWADPDGTVRRIDHLDSGGHATRQLMLDEIKTVGGARLAHHMVVNDLKRKRSTQARIKEVTVDAGISPEIFTVTNLERP